MVTDDPYIPEELLGTGPSAKVYRGHDLNMAHTVRLKVLMDSHVSCPADPACVASVAPALHQLSHAHIGRCLALDVNGDDVTLVSEFSPGTNVWVLLQHHRLSPDELRVLAIQLLLALEAGEAQHQHHGDVKPSNVIISREGPQRYSLQLQDWGLAACRCRQPHETMSYRAPEFLEEGYATSQSDLFSLGATLATMLLGHAPVHGGKVEEWRKAWKAYNVKTLRQARPDLDTGMLDWLGWLLHYDPAQRPASALQARQALPPPAPTVGANVPAPSVRSEEASTPKPRKGSGFMFNLTLLGSTVGVLMWMEPAWSQPWSNEVRFWLANAWETLQSLKQSMPW
jgi:serine/threonine protein kinase